MRVNHYVTFMLVLLLGFVLTGCAGLSTRNSADITCTSKDINAMLKSGGYQKKVDNFLIILDASSSMDEKIGPVFSNEPTKLTLAKDLIKCINSSLPDDFDVNAGMRVVGPVDPDKALIYGMSNYSTAGLDNAVRSVTGTGGMTPLANGLINGANDLLDTPGLTDNPGRTAVILFSDGVNTDAAAPVAAVGAMKEMYGDNICVYTVLLGDDPAGKATMEQIAEAGKCGFATEADNLHTRKLSYCCDQDLYDGMSDFVTAVFLEKAPLDLDSDGDGVIDRLDRCPNTPKGVRVDSKGCPLDSDGDGVPDYLDKCPDTPKGIKVDKLGCPVPIPDKVSITLLVEFDFDKSFVRPQYHSDIERVANFLKAYPKTTGELEGHTDSIGSDAYNMNLSRRRAESVKNYLVEKFNTDASRLSAVGFGESKPIASNDTKAGRQKNRRVVANIVTIVVK